MQIEETPGRKNAWSKVEKTHGRCYRLKKSKAFAFSKTNVRDNFPCSNFLDTTSYYIIRFVRVE